MRNKADMRRTRAPELPRDVRADEILEFVFNDEDEALCDGHAVLSQQREMPALQEFLQEMYEIDSRTSAARRH